MADQKDTYRAAQIIIKEHGADAHTFALSKVDNFIAGEDVVAASMWLMIAQAIDELQKMTSVQTTVH